MDENEILPEGEHAEVIGRLRAFGAAPLDAGPAARTLERLRRAGPAWRRFPLKVLVAAAIGAFAFGGLGLAAADVLPAPVQDAAHTALDQVGVHVPPGHDRYNDPAQCPGGPYRNHGAYVRSHKNDPNAGKSPCGKPVQAVNGSDANKGKDDNASERPEGAGPPPWAHGNKNKHKDKDKSAKESKQPGATGSHGEEPDDAPGAGTQPHTTTPPSASTTTTSAPPSSTTTTSTSAP